MLFGHGHDFQRARHRPLYRVFPYLLFFFPFASFAYPTWCHHFLFNHVSHYSYILQKTKNRQHARSLVRSLGQLMFHAFLIDLIQLDQIAEGVVIVVV